MSEKLRECPFCKCNDEDDLRAVHAGRGYFYCECENCGGRSGWAGSKDGAIKLWNTRAGDKAVDQAPRVEGVEIEKLGLPWSAFHRKGGLKDWGVCQSDGINEVCQMFHDGTEEWPRQRAELIAKAVNFYCAALSEPAKGVDVSPDYTVEDVFECLRELGAPDKYFSGHPLPNLRDYCKELQQKKSTPDPRDKAVEALASEIKGSENYEFYDEDEKRFIAVDGDQWDEIERQALVALSEMPSAEEGR